MGDQLESARAAGESNTVGPRAENSLLGDFELRHEIGRGGMGTVYAAWQRSLKRLVAVKVLSHQVSATRTAVVRFQREAQAAAKLHHAHIVPIFGAGDVDGVYFYAMELIDGPGLNSVIQMEHGQSAANTDLAETLPLSGSANGVGSGPSDPSGSASGSTITNEGDSESADSLEVDLPDGHYSTVASHIASVADALDYAHRQGVIHRDVKPHNLILGDDGKMRISDFGLARLTEQPGVTVTGEMLGSPLYMSPEQITGGPAGVDHRTDIYSLGATLYEWLTHQAPYPGETREQVISKILTSEPVALRTHNSLIPPDLETICLKAIERDPDRRYQSAGDLCDDLVRFVEKRPIRARRASVGLRIKKFIGRHRVGSLGVAAAAVAVTLTVALVSAEREVKTQTAAAEQEKEERKKIEDLLSFLPFEFEGPLRLAGAVRPMLEGVVSGDKTGEGATEQDQGQVIEVSTVATPAGIAQRASGDLLRKVMPASTGLRTEPDSADICATALSRALENWETQPSIASDFVDICLATKPDHFDARQLHAALGAQLDRFEDMRKDADEMVRLDPKREIAFVWRALAFILLGDSARSLSDLDQAELLGGMGPWVPAVRGLAMALDENHLDAISAFDRALEIDPDLIVALFGRASARAAFGNVGGAVSDLTQALELEPENADVLALRGDHNFEQEDFEAAEQDYERAMAIAGRTSSIVLRYLLAYSRHRNSLSDN